MRVFQACDVGTDLFIGSGIAFLNPARTYAQNQSPHEPSSFPSRPHVSRPVSEASVRLGNISEDVQCVQVKGSLVVAMHPLPATDSPISLLSGRTLLD